MLVISVFVDVSYINLYTKINFYLVYMYMHIPISLNCCVLLIVCLNVCLFVYVHNAYTPSAPYSETLICVEIEMLSCIQRLEHKV